MYEQQNTGIQRKRPGGRFGGIGGTFVGNAMTDIMAPALLKVPRIANNPKFAGPIRAYMNRNKERGTQSSAVYRQIPM